MRSGSCAIFAYCADHLRYDCCRVLHRCCMVSPSSPNARRDERRRTRGTHDVDPTSGPVQPLASRYLLTPTHVHWAKVQALRETGNSRRHLRGLIALLHLPSNPLRRRGGTLFPPLLGPCRTLRRRAGARPPSGAERSRFLRTGQRFPSRTPSPRGTRQQGERVRWATTLGCRREAVA